MLKCCARIMILFFVVNMESACDAQEAIYDEARLPKFTLPDPLTTLSGQQVQSAAQWNDIRRPEVLRLFEDNVFGRLPEIDVPLRTAVISEDRMALGGGAIRREISIQFGDGQHAPTMIMLVYTPAAAKGPVPAFLGFNFNGNHTVDSDPSIHVTESWVRDNESIGVSGNRATAESRGSSAGRWPANMIVDRGYGLATIYYGDVDPDFDDGFRNGIHALVGADDKRTATSGGSISAWAWGLSRALDVLQDDPKIDASRVAVFGHSRLGKTSLWAGATDPRFAMVISNDSGCGGAALSRRRFGESVRRINTSFPHWFNLKHREYNDNENASPVDHHMLIALMAPRPVYVASAQEDRWADPHGEFLSVYHAGPVYRLFGKQPIPSITMPDVNQSVQTDVGYHVRTGKHDVTTFDWRQYLDFADKHLRP
jgi:(4-O-methyl)-D-glucuronate---lignin esterase